MFSLCFCTCVFAHHSLFPTNEEKKMSKEKASDQPVAYNKTHYNSLLLL